MNILTKAQEIKTQKDIDLKEAQKNNQIPGDFLKELFASVRKIVTPLDGELCQFGVMSVITSPDKADAICEIKTTGHTILTISYNKYESPCQENLHVSFLDLQCLKGDSRREITFTIDKLVLENLGQWLINYVATIL